MARDCVWATSSRCPWRRWSGPPSWSESDRTSRSVLARCKASCEYFRVCSGGFELTKKQTLGTFETCETDECVIPREDAGRRRSGRPRGAPRPRGGDPAGSRLLSTRLSAFTGGSAPPAGESAYLRVRASLRRDCSYGPPRPPDGSERIAWFSALRGTIGGAELSSEDRLPGPDCRGVLGSSGNHRAVDDRVRRELRTERGLQLHHVLPRGGSPRAAPGPTRGGVPDHDHRLPRRIEPGPESPVPAWWLQVTDRR
jgi:hypothetical protein